MKIYLAGCISYLDKVNLWEKATAWRNYIVRELSYYVEDGSTFFNNPTSNYETNLMYSGKNILTQNIKNVTESDIIIVNLDFLKESPGTLFEIYLAYMQRKPILAFGGKDDEFAESLHVKECITENFDRRGFPEIYDIDIDNIEDLLECIKNLYL